NVPGYTRMELSPPNYKDWKRLATSFEAMGAYTDWATNLTGAGEPQRVESALVTADVLPMLGVEPFLGRLLSAEDDKPGAPKVLLLSYGLWQSQFGASRDALGQTVRLDDAPATIVGVLPADFQFPYRTTRLWRPLPLSGQDNEDRGNNYLNVVAKRNPDA